MSIAPFESTLIQELLAGQAAAWRQPSILLIRYIDHNDKVVLDTEFVYDPQFADHYLKDANKKARSHGLWADRVEFILMNRDKAPIVSASFKRYDIPTKWMF